MLLSSEADTNDDSENSAFYPLSIPELDDGEGEESKKLEIEVQVMFYEGPKAILTSIRMHELADDSPALEYTISGTQPKWW